MRKALVKRYRIAQGLFFKVEMAHNKSTFN
jgi:hypothetical protein